MAKGHEHLDMVHRLGVLFSGGKDSTNAMHYRWAKSHLTCLITVVSENDASFMFHTPNIGMVDLQAECLGLPLVKVTTKGEKEAELDDLYQAIKRAKEEHKITGVLTGAVRSTYQAARIQKICADLDLWCFNPLWLMDQVELLHEIVDGDIKAIVSGVFAEGLAGVAGKMIDKELIKKLEALGRKGINPAGEGGEFESTVLDAPLFKKKIVIEKASLVKDGHCELYRIEKAKVVPK